MTKQDFFEELIDILELEVDSISEQTAIDLDSLSTLAIIAFLDDHFLKQVKAEDLRTISSVKDIIVLAGPENIE